MEIRTRTYSCLKSSTGCEAVLQRQSLKLCYTKKWSWYSAPVFVTCTQVLTALPFLYQLPFLLPASLVRMAGGTGSSPANEQTRMTGESSGEIAPDHRKYSPVELSGQRSSCHVNTGRVKCNIHNNVQLNSICCFFFFLKHRGTTPPQKKAHQAWLSLSQNYFPWK